MASKKWGGSRKGRHEKSYGNGMVGAIRPRMSRWSVDYPWFLTQTTSGGGEALCFSGDADTMAGAKKACDAAYESIQREC